MPTSVSNGISKREQAALCDEAFDLMERALALLDQAGQRISANHLDHAIAVIADDGVGLPRPRLNRPAQAKRLDKD